MFRTICEYPRRAVMTTTTTTATTMATCAAPHRLEIRFSPYLRFAFAYVSPGMTTRTRHGVYNAYNAFAWQSLPCYITGLEVFSATSVCIIDKSIS